MNYNMLNKILFALPHVEEAFDILNVATSFSTVYMESGYYQVSVEESHNCHTAFTVGPLGFIEFNKMQFPIVQQPITA